MEPMEITAGRLHLRPWCPADAEVVAEALRDPEIRRWAPRTPKEPDEKTWIADRIAGWADGSSASFAITDATTGKVLGHIRLRTPGDGVGEVGYWILAGARGRGVAGHAVGAVARWAFACLDLSRLDLRHVAENPASCRVAQKGGFALARLLTEPSWDGGDETVEVHLHTLPHG
ncbi:GNAT family N-acetyltransferase [Streptosporangium sp. NPDC087985]|uniref:GNAT family N-acetyltransferase n=1 Tax=Streptosporangium sp. NPDC087985 TaxID=3366196 RepID=UPI00381A290C